MFQVEKAWLGWRHDHSVKIVGLYQLQNANIRILSENKYLSCVQIGANRKAKASIYFSSTNALK